jgi:Fe-S cluster biosynthesis and repair protein YggX
MSEINERIERFTKMATADPTTELGHFSLGRALMDAGRYADAVESLRRVIAIDATRSKAYQMLGESLMKLDRKGEAVATLTDGATIADNRGEMLPRNEMAEMLKSLGAAVPAFKAAAAAPAAPIQAGEGEVMCKRCGKLGPRMRRQPFRNDFGKLIYENTCEPCWQEAIRMGTKVINELRLDLSDPRAQQAWDTNIREFLNLG